MTSLSSTVSAAPSHRKRLGLSRRFFSGLGIAALNLGLLLLPNAIAPGRALGAERLYFAFGPIDLAVPVADLEVYAKEGRLEPELEFYARRLNQEQLQQLRSALTTRINLTPVAVAQFLYSPVGETLLRRVGEVVQTQTGQEGFYALRAAMIQAAASPDGLTLLGVLQQYPTYGIRLDSERAFQIVRELSEQIRQTELAISAVQTQAIDEVSEISGAMSTDFNQLPDLRQPGLVRWQKQTLTLNDIRRNRVIPTDLYLPQAPVPAPLVIISHGLGSDRTAFQYLAEHLASYGFAVAVPEHPGSSNRQIQALSTGFSRDVTPAKEFVDRPLDVQYLLSRLERDYARQINIEQVGILGQSFGGYTALATAGGQLNFEQLREDCFRPENSLNLSLVLQCRALSLPRDNYGLQDDRIKAAMAINPFSSSIFGEAGLSNIRVPVMVVAGSADTVTPALSEQIQPFTWLNNLNRYLVLIQQGTHFSTINETEREVPIPAAALGPSPEVAQDYMKALSVAFMKTYVTDDLRYHAYLNPNYAQAISTHPLSLSLVRALTPTQLTQVAGREAPAAPPEEVN